MPIVTYVPFVFPWYGNPKILKEFSTFLEDSPDNLPKFNPIGSPANRDISYSKVINIDVDEEGGLFRFLP